MLLCVPLAAAPAAHAQTVTLTTPYPAVTVAPGDKVTFDVSVSSSPDQRLDLRVDAPEGWETTLRGGGFVISSVFGDADVTLEVSIPPDAEGRHQVTLIADGDGAASRLPLTLSVTGGAQGALALEAEFATLSGQATDTFDYTVTLRNALPGETTFALSVVGPPGWDVSAHPSAEQRATTVTVEGGGTATVNVTADPPDDVTAGTYPIVLTATGGGREASVELTAEVTGNVDMTLTTPDERLNADGTAGGQTRVPLVLVNNGSAPLAGVTFSASPPSGWEVTFEPETVNVDARSSTTVNALITPSDDAVAGDYMVTLTAEVEGQRTSVDIRYTVETSRWWGLVGVLIIVAVAAGLWYVFRVYGRR
ncbi:MAG: NEW3 domain-containing protein [Micromonosporaceae bacterium]